MRRVSAIAMIVCLLRATDIAGTAAQDQPVFGSGSDLVRVFVTVTDGERLVTALTREDFEVRDEGRPQPIEVFDNSPTPIRLITMLDVSGSMYGNLALIRAAAGELFARLGPNDLGRVVLLGHEITISARFTRSVPELLAILPRSIEPTAPTPLWRAMAEALRVLEEPSEERRVILVLSDGKDDTGSPRSGPIGYTADFVIDRARRNDVMIYAIGLYSRLSNRYVTPGSFTSALNDDTPDPNLERVAAESGGGYIEIRRGEDLAAAFTRVADELHSQYLLGFTPPERDGKKHDIGVRVLKRGMQPRARKSYVAPER